MSLWDNETFKQAWEGMSEDQRKDYTRVGELVYNTIDYETGEVYSNSALELQELLMAINSGIVREIDLSTDEMKLLQNYYTDNDIKELFKRNETITELLYR